MDVQICSRPIRGNHMHITIYLLASSVQFAPVEMPYKPILYPSPTNIDNIHPFLSCRQRPRRFRTITTSNDSRSSW